MTRRTLESDLEQRALAWLEYFAGRPDIFRNPMCDDGEQLVRELLDALQETRRNDTRAARTDVVSAPIALPQRRTESQA